MFSASQLALAYLLLEWAIRLAMVVIIPLRRPPESARSWLLLVLFLPVPVNRRPKRTPYRRAKGTPFVKQRDGYGGRTVRAGCGVGRA